jgi:general secretion pathway protein I
MKRRPTSAGFSLLEVMVAVAILGLGLTAILSAQAGSFSAATHARSLSVATGLSRCKMLELEAKLAKDGFPEIDENDSGPCCDDDDRETMRCTWKIEKPVLPEPALGDLNLGADLNLGGPSSGAPGGGSPGGLGALASLAGPNSSLSSVPSNGKVGDVAQGFAGALAESGGVDGLAGMAMSFVYPDLKKFFEAGTRRVTVTVHWADGSTDRTLEVMQWYTKAAPPVAAIPTATSSGGGAGAAGAPGR